jgi:hypothetical protein
MKKIIEKIIFDSILHIENKTYQSYDLFDALTCDWINKVTNKSDILRRIAIQVNAKSPINLHSVGMKKLTHTKLISDLLWTLSLNNFTNKTIPIYHKLIDLKCNNNYSVWGLNFPYTSRFINADSKTPNIYNTASSGLSLCEFYNIDIPLKGEIETNITEIIDAIFQVFSFNDENTKGWFAYYPKQQSPTYNVNALTAYFLCKANETLKKECVSKEIIEKLINLLIEEQNLDGSWFYSRSSKGKWIDGFHSGFIIESLAYVYSHGFKSEKLNNTLKRAWNYYIKNLFTEEGLPKYFSNGNKFPIEAQNCAQAIQTISLVGIWLDWNQRELLEKVIQLTIKFLYNPNGYFYYKKTRIFTYKQSYLRWSTAPMLVAFSYANLYLNNQINLSK